MYPIHLGELRDFAIARTLLVRVNFTEPVAATSASASREFVRGRASDRRSSVGRSLGRQYRVRRTEKTRRMFDDAVECDACRAGSERSPVPLVMFPTSDRSDGPLKVRIRQWLGPHEREFDVALVVRRSIAPQEFAFDSLARSGAVPYRRAKWKELFEADQEALLNWETRAASIPEAVRTLASGGFLMPPQVSGSSMTNSIFGVGKSPGT